MPGNLDRFLWGARHFTSILATVMMLLPGVPALAQDTVDTSGTTITNGVLIYYAVLPAGLIRAYSANSPERRMHGGVPDGKHVHHLLVALFDAVTNERITDAAVTARITETGLGSETLTLEPFDAGGDITFGNYFEFGRAVPYRVEIDIVRPGGMAPITTQFEYRHH